MDQKADILKHGAQVCHTHAPYTGLNNRSYADAASTAQAQYILVEERFITSHDDSAGFVELIDDKEHVICSWKFDYPMKKRFSEPDLYDDDCLVLYLRETFSVPVLGNTPQLKGILNGECSW